MSLSPTELRRLEKLETFVERLTLGSYLAKAADTGGKVVGQPLSAGDRDLARAATGTPDLTSVGEDVLAKAVSAFSDPTALLAFADRNIGPPAKVRY